MKAGRVNRDTISTAFVADSGDSWSENFLLHSPKSAFNALMYIYSSYTPHSLPTILHTPYRTNRQALIFLPVPHFLLTESWKI